MKPWGCSDWNGKSSRPSGDFQPPSLSLVPPIASPRFRSATQGFCARACIPFRFPSSLRNSPFPCCGIREWMQILLIVGCANASAMCAQIRARTRPNGMHESHEIDVLAAMECAVSFSICKGKAGHLSINAIPTTAGVAGALSGRYFSRLPAVMARKARTTHTPFPDSTAARRLG